VTIDFIAKAAEVSYFSLSRNWYHVAYCPQYCQKTVELQTLTAMGDLPAYTAFAQAADSSMAQVLEPDRLKFCTKLQDQA